MRKLVLLPTIWFGLSWTVVTYAQQAATGEKLSVEQRMAKARAVKAQKRIDKVTGKLDVSAVKSARATPADYRAPVDKVLRGPNGEVVHTGERGAKFYINKNGNKTYLSSNQ